MTAHTIDGRRKGTLFKHCYGVVIGLVIDQEDAERLGADQMRGLVEHAPRLNFKETIQSKGARHHLSKVGSRMGLAFTAD